MKFVKRDFILLAGSILFMFGLIPFMEPAYAVMIAIGIFFGIKIFTYNRQKFLEKTIGEGFCVECGKKIIDKKCPNCNKTEES